MTGSRLGLAPFLRDIPKVGLCIALAAACVCALDLAPPAFASSGLVPFTRSHDVDGVLAWAGSDAIVVRAGQNRIVRVVPSTGAEIDLWHSSAPLAFHADAVSADGEQVVVQPFDLRSFQALSVYRRPGVTLVSSPAGHLQAIAHKWRPDGQRVAYVNDYAGGEVATVDSAGGTPNILLPDDFTRLRRLLSYGNDGRLFVIDQPRNGNAGALLRIVEGGATTQLATNVDSGATSPDGSTVVYFTHDGTLHAISSTGGDPVSLGAFGVNPHNSSFAFSPDGSRVTAGALDSNSNWIAFIVQLDGSGVVILPGVRTFDWAPDGSRLVADLVNASLVTFAADGSDKQVLSNQMCLTPTFSPDGRRVACVLHTSKGNDLAIWTIRSPAASVRRFLPMQGPPGTTVTINGSGLTGATAVRFNGIDASSFTVDSPTQITAVVPAGAYSDTISITAPGGTVTTRQPFRITSVVDVESCLATGAAEVPGGSQPLLTAAWHMASSAYLPVLLSSTTTRIRISGNKSVAAQWDNVGRSDGAGGWRSDLSYDSRTILIWPDENMGVEFHVVAKKPFSDGFATYARGQELFPSPFPLCLVSVE